MAQGQPIRDLLLITEQGMNHSLIHQSPCLFSLQSELSFPRWTVRILNVIEALLLLPRAFFLMDSRKLFGVSIQVLTAQLRHEQLTTRALLLHWFLGKGFYRFTALSLDRVALIFFWGNVMKFLWRKYAFPLTASFFGVIFFSSLPEISPRTDTLFLRQGPENSYLSLSNILEVNLQQN